MPSQPAVYTHTVNPQSAIELFEVKIMQSTTVRVTAAVALVAALVGVTGVVAATQYAADQTNETDGMGQHDGTHERGQAGMHGGPASAGHEDHTDSDTSGVGHSGRCDR